MRRKKQAGRSPNVSPYPCEQATSLIKEDEAATSSVAISKQHQPQEFPEAQPQVIAPGVTK